MFPNGNVIYVFLYEKPTLEFNIEVSPDVRYESRGPRCNSLFFRRALTEN